MFCESRLKRSLSLLKPSRSLKNLLPLVLLNHFDILCTFFLNQNKLNFSLENTVFLWMRVYEGAD